MASSCQAVLGGVTVLLGLHPGVVAARFLISMGLVGRRDLALVRGPRGAAARRVPLVAPGRVRLAGSTVVAWAWSLVLGTVVTGSGPHSGRRRGTLPVRPRPSHRRLAARRSVVRLYLALVVATWLAARLGRGPRRASAPRGRSLVLLGVSLAQGALRYVQYFTGLPAALVVVLMIGASLLVVALTLRRPRAARGAPGGPVLTRALVVEQARTGPGQRHGLPARRGAKTLARMLGRRARSS